MKESLRTVIETLRRQRVRQDDFMAVLDCIVEQSKILESLEANADVHKTARYMKATAIELRRIAKSVPKFVVEDLIHEAVAQLEALGSGLSRNER